MKCALCGRPGEQGEDRCSRCFELEMLIELDLHTALVIVRKKLEEQGFWVREDGAGDPTVFPPRRRRWKQ